MTDLAKHAELWYIGSENIVYRRDADGMHCVAACNNADTARLVIAARDLLAACEAALAKCNFPVRAALVKEHLTAAIALAKSEQND